MQKVQFGADLRTLVIFMIKIITSSKSFKVTNKHFKLYVCIYAHICMYICTYNTKNSPDLCLKVCLIFQIKFHICSALTTNSFYMDKLGFLPVCFN